MKTFAMMVLGCKVNDYEATYLRTKLRERFTEVSFKDVADCYIIFTCCVTNTAEAKTRKMFHRARALNPDAYVVAVGCMSQVRSDSSDFDGVDLIVGSADKDNLVNMIIEGATGNKVKDLKDLPFEELYLDTYPGKSRAFLKIQDGCNQFCTYCIIPYARGRERCADHLTVLKQCENLKGETKEIVLTGIHTGRYNDNGYTLTDLLMDMVKIDGIETIRLSSIEITEITDGIIDLMATNPKIGRNLHIPVQAMSNEVLSAMHRPYTIEEFIERIEYIRNRVPGVSISTDLIVGFPGESDEIFENSLANLERIRFSFIHVFPYAAKKGTAADLMKNKVPEISKKKRVLKIIDLEKKYTEEYQRTFIGREVEVLIERCVNGVSSGYSKEYFYVEAEGEYEIGSIQKFIVSELSEDGVKAYHAA